MNLALSELGITEMTRLFPHAGEYEERTRREGLHRWYVVKYSQDVPMTKAQTSLEEVEGIHIYEPVRKIRINDFNDLTSDLWGLYNQSNPGFDINVRPVWDNFTTGNPDVIVSVVDAGVDLNHEDLADNCLSTGHYNFVNNNSYIVPCYHGTHVGGTIAAVNNNKKGIVGIAGGDKAKGQKGVKLMSCQIFVDNPDGTTDQAPGATAIKYGADNGAVISQNSWGYSFDRNHDGEVSGDEMKEALNATISASDKAAVDYFVKYAGCDNKGNQLPGSPMKGGVVIFAAGNEGIPNGAPAEYDGVIAVGAVTPDGSRASFSNYGPWVDICAPGTSILSTIPGNQYDYSQGTSMACPHVSGVAALIVSYFGGPGFTNEMLKSKLLESSNKSAISQTRQVGGLVDAYGAFVYGNDKAPSEVTDLEVSATGNKVDLTWTMTGDEDGKPAYGLLVLYGKDKSKVEAATPQDMQGVDYAACAPDLPVGEKAQFSITGLDFEDQYYLKAFAYSYGRSYSAATKVFAVATTENHAPEIILHHEGEIALMSSETLTIPFEIIDPDGHAFFLEYDKGSDAESIMPNTDGTMRLILKGSAADVGTYTLKLTAIDEFGLSTTLPVTYKIKENSAPVKIKEIENVLLTAKGKEFIIDMDEYVTDPDGEQLKYDITISNQTIAHLTAKNNQLIGTALGYGVVDVNVKAKDARGESVTFDFKVQVKDPSKPLSVYPNPVTDYVNVGTLDMAETNIKIYSSTGQLVHEETSQVSGVEPARIDMRECAPGNYSLQVTFGGKEYKQNIVKL
jgi:subtilisin family serine protease